MSAASAPDTASRSSASARITLGMLAFVYVLNFLDRQLISILAKPIQDGLGITDGQLGLLTGFYFALFYCFIAIPIGWLADRTSRVKVLSAACAIWSAATAACGMAGTYGQLVVARMMVGVGEAGGVPPSYAIISDTFPRERRTTAMAIFNLGPPIGSALGVAFGASLAAAFDWRMPFYVIGGIGVVTAVVVYWVVREPKRGETDGLPVTTAPEVGPEGFVATILRFFRNPLLLMASLASGAGNFITYGLLNFTVLFLMREKGMTLEDVAVWYALVVGIGMSTGIYASGRIVDRFARRSKAAYATVPAASLVLALPFFIGFAWAPSWKIALAFLLVPMFLNSFFLSATVTFVQNEVAPERRVISGALLLLVMNFIGLGLGPTYVGMMSDFFRPAYGEHALQTAYYALAPMYLIGALLFLCLARLIKRAEATNPA
ncbi:MAG: MFS transporter [Erythrobacter sp.]|jgi:predicted MFS family arabinose efflux permease|uniref:spinster family MFS transporter n=1 Tax=Qipengyuania citrea TaxID=225971 RepID=UPI001A3C302B|nr:MFS transporter [Qipengyuania citrea]MBL4717921.1 MFS transporter [Erythrobacter sp.]MCP2018809.1 putative MFS family arabinose efflux permease [Qipengyuania citrea]MDE0902152.1 MFS transporter [Erythrobacter sp.]